MTDRIARTVAAELAEHGWSVAARFIGPQALSSLIGDCRRAWAHGDFRRAGVGRGASWELRPNVRNDRVLWLDGDALTGSQRRYYARLERLRLAINRSMLLGLFEFEAHLTVYPAGAYYRRHLDRFADADHRLVSTILYLNENWQPDDGGELRLYVGDDRHVDIAPTGGTLVSFVSERYYHEVLPARRERMSITGWFTRRR